MFIFEELNVYKEALNFVDVEYEGTKKWPQDERFGLVDQYRRAGSSIVLNIAEGSSRTKKDFGHFLGMARGSCYECVAITQIARSRKLLSYEEYGKHYARLEMLSKMITALKKTLL